MQFPKNESEINAKLMPYPCILLKHTENDCVETEPIVLICPVLNVALLSIGCNKLFRWRSRIKDHAIATSNSKTICCPTFETLFSQHPANGPTGFPNIPQRPGQCGQNLPDRRIERPTIIINLYTSNVCTNFGKLISWLNKSRFKWSIQDIKYERGRTGFVRMRASRNVNEYANFIKGVILLIFGN